jgi:hypothetical protein
MRLTIARLRAIADALAKLDPENRSDKLPERHYYEAGAWVTKEIKRRNSLKKEPEMF